MLFFYEFSALSHYNLPIASLFAPQFLEENFRIQSFVRKDFGLINRYGFGVSYKNLGFFWYSLNVEDEFLNTIGFGMNIFSIGSNLIYLYPDKISFGIGFNRAYLNFNLCGYTIYGYLKFSYLCAFTDYRNTMLGIDIFLQDGYDLEYKFFLDYRLNDKMSFHIAFATSSNGFTIAYRYRYIVFNYFYHSYFGDSFGMNLVYEKN